MDLDYTNWSHVTKLDPDKDISGEQIEQIVDAGTDAIMISGSLNITREKISELRAKIKADVPIILEPNHPSVFSYNEFDYVFVLSVLNGTKETLIDNHMIWAKEYTIDWNKVVPEAYIVLNPDSSVAKVTKANTDLTIEEVVAYAKIAEKYLHFPIIYLEYSGIYGDLKVVKNVNKSLEKSRLFYGGGIDSKDKAKEMQKYANTIVVGNIFYENFEKGLETII